jgi:hypothetical protein
MAVAAGGAAWACDDGSDAAFILRSGDGSTQMIGSLDDLHHVRRAFRDDKNVILWTRIDGDEYLVSDPPSWRGRERSSGRAKVSMRSRKSLKRT